MAQPEYSLGMPAFPKPIHLSHQFIREVIQPGDVVVDATLGNGHDALFLSKLVGAKGFVYGFDVQKEAVESATKKMGEAGCDVFQFFLAGHENMVNEVEPGVAVVMFNLGYLPKADKAVITTVETTIPALEQALHLLKKGGLISIMCYPGHAGGDVESEAVEAWSSELAREDNRVAKYALLNAPNNPPFLIMIEKLRD